MSVRNPRFVLAPTARSDLRDILNYTEQQWDVIFRGKWRDFLSGMWHKPSARYAPTTDEQITRRAA